MGTDFRNSSPDLASTCFEAADLAMARSVYKDMFAEVDPDWPSNPVGPLGNRWLSAGPHSVAYLIHVSQVLWKLSNKNVTAKSYSTLCEKARMLLRPPSAAAYEETLIELEVAASLSERASPVSFEPLVPEELANSPSKPKSPDYALRLPDADVTIEVTVWHWETLQRWDVMVNELKKRLSVGMTRADLSRQISIDLPLRASSEKVVNSVAKDVLQAMEQASSGELVVDVYDGDARIQWFEIPHFQSVEEFKAAPLPADMHMATTGNFRVDAAVGFATRPIVTGRSVDGALTSLRKSIDRKSGQHHPQLPHVLALALGNQRLHWDWILPMFAERIWPNEKYKWISALCAFTPRRDWSQSSRNAHLNFEWNPGATIPVPFSFRALIEAGASYHLPCT